MELCFLDTDVCVDLLRNRVRGRRLPGFAQCRLSSVVVAELWAGASKAADPTVQGVKLAGLLDALEQLPFGAEAARHYGSIRAALEQAGTPIGPLDQLIAAHSRSADATLLTANLREFKRVPGLKCQAWE